MINCVYDFLNLYYNSQTFITKIGGFNKFFSNQFVGIIEIAITLIKITLTVSNR